MPHEYIILFSQIIFQMINLLLIPRPDSTQIMLRGNEQLISQFWEYTFQICSSVTQSFTFKERLQIKSPIAILSVEKNPIILFEEEWEFILQHPSPHFVK